MSFERTGRFRCLAQASTRLLAFEPTDADLMTSRDETLILEFDPSISEDELDDIANLLNGRIRRVVVRAL